MVKVWIGLDTKMTWLGLVQDHGHGVTVENRKQTTSLLSKSDVL